MYDDRNAHPSDADASANLPEETSPHSRDAHAEDCPCNLTPADHDRLVRCCCRIRLRGIGLGGTVRCTTPWCLDDLPKHITSVTSVSFRAA